MTPKTLNDLMLRLHHDTMFSSATQNKCSDAYNRLGRPLSMGLGRHLPGPYQVLLDNDDIASANLSWLPLDRQLRMASDLCVAFGMYDAHDLYKGCIQKAGTVSVAYTPWHQEVVELLDNILTTQRNTSNSDTYKTAYHVLRDEAVAMPETSEALKQLRFHEFHQRQDSSGDQWKDFLGLMAQAGLLDALVFLDSRVSVSIQ